MAIIKIKIDDLFKRLNIQGDMEKEEESYDLLYNIKVRNHENNFVPIKKLVRKKTDSWVINFSNGKKIISSNKHILSTSNGEKMIFYTIYV